jgi:hypothetical protein
MSLPDALFAVVAAFLFLRAAADRGDQGRGVGDFLWDLIERFNKRREVLA